MLQVTDQALTVLHQMRADTPEVPDSAAVRLQLMSTGEGEPGLGFGFAEQPGEEDQKVAGNEEIDVFVAPELVEPLGQAVVDTVETDDGKQLVLKEQEGTPEQG